MAVLHSLQHLLLSFTSADLAAAAAAAVIVIVD
jgi:hypothetical protein